MITIPFDYQPVLSGLKRKNFLKKFKNFLKFFEQYECFRNNRAQNSHILGFKQFTNFLLSYSKN